MRRTVLARSTLLYLLLLTSGGCFFYNSGAPEKIPVIFDTDTNNELDDQHALAYLLLNQERFQVEGITVNATRGGGNVDMHYQEAKRVMDLCNAKNIPLLKGANGSFAGIDPGDSAYDGKEAVDFILEKARNARQELVLLAVGKLTNVALAVAKDLSAFKKVRVVWLGSNYPEPGEYNQDNDSVAMNYLLNHDVNFEMVTVRFGKASGTAAVRIPKEHIDRDMPGIGPKADKPVTGRHGGSFQCFGDYSVDLFSHIDLNGDPPSRALFDLAAVAIVKEPGWATSREHPAPVFNEGTWVERPMNEHSIVVWENFDRDGIIGDLFATLKRHTPGAK